MFQDFKKTPYCLRLSYNENLTGTYIFRCHCSSAGGSPVSPASALTVTLRSLIMWLWYWHWQSLLACTSRNCDSQPHGHWMWCDVTAKGPVGDTDVISSPADHLNSSHPSLPQVSVTHAPGIPHDLKENMIHETKPSSSIVPLSNSYDHMPTLGTFRGWQGSAWVLWPVCVYTAPKAAICKSRSVLKPFYLGQHSFSLAIL